MNNLSYNEAFKKAYGNSGKNFVTPTVEKTMTTDKYHVEISSGVGIFSPRIYGITVVTLDGEKSDLSTCERTMEEVELYVNEHLK